jgi:hypothetical protein
LRGREISLSLVRTLGGRWIPGHAADWLSDRYQASRPVIDEAAAAVGRDPHEIRTVFNFPGRITDRPLPATRDRDGCWIGGSAAQWSEELTGAVLDHGAAGFMLFSPQGGTLTSHPSAAGPGRSSRPCAKQSQREAADVPCGVSWLAGRAASPAPGRREPARGQRVPLGWGPASVYGSGNLHNGVCRLSQPYNPDRGVWGQCVVLV